MVYQTQDGFEVFVCAVYSGACINREILVLVDDATRSSSKAGYHHGNLRDHLIAATRSLIDEHGPEHFKVADACRLAGVSTAAPYRHFSDREALLEAVAIAGFHDLRDEARAAGRLLPQGSTEAISAIGKAYVLFAIREPNLFRLMFSHNSSGSDESEMESDTGIHESPKDDVGSSTTLCGREAAGRECYEVLLEQLVFTLKRDVIDEEVIKAAFPLWTFVHGLSFLVIDGNLAVNQLPIDIMQQIDFVSSRLMP